MLFKTKKRSNEEIKLGVVFQFPLDLQTAFAFALSGPVGCHLWGS